MELFTAPVTVPLPTVPAVPSQQQGSLKDCVPPCAHLEQEPGHPQGLSLAQGCRGDKSPAKTPLARGWHGVGAWPCSCPSNQSPAGDVGQHC